MRRQHAQALLLAALVHLWLLHVRPRSWSCMQQGFHASSKVAPRLYFCRSGACRRLPRKADREEGQRSSFDSSPEWVKSVVSGLTFIVNSLVGDGQVIEVQRQRHFETISPDTLLEGIRADFEERQYLWTGDIDVELYDEACIFTDPTLSFQGLSTFESNIRNLRPILDNVVPAGKRKCLLHNLSRDEGTGKVYAEWTMIGDLVLPWSPRIQLRGRTAYSPGPDGRIVSYDENWDISAGEALLQILTLRFPPDPHAAEHWPERFDGAPPPTPRITLDDAPVFVVLPGFGNDAIDYSRPLGQDEVVGLLACMQRRGCRAVTVPVQRLDWLQVFTRGLADEDFRAGNGTASVAFGWYLDATQVLVEETVSHSSGPVVLVGHSAGGWLARALMQREGKDWVSEHVRGLVTLGSPHFPPPPDVSDMTMGCLRNLHEQQPGAFYSDLIFYVTVAGDAVRGEQVVGNLPILELIQSPSQESTAFNSYRVVCGIGNTTGDGVVPLMSAHLEGARQVTIKDCLHSINKAGTTQPTDKAYMCEGRVDDWLGVVVEELSSRPLLNTGD